MISFKDVNDPLYAGRFNVPTLIKNKISLRSDRKNGQFINSISGTFLRIEACDLPCSISFNNGDFNQSVPCVPGLVIAGPFTGITLYHDDYSTSSIRSSPSLSITTGRNTSQNYDSALGKTAQSVAYRVASSGTSFLSIEFPISLGYNQVVISGTYQYNNASPLVLNTNLLFYDNGNGSAGQVINSGNIIRPPVIYNFSGTNNSQAISGLINGASCFNNYSVVVDIPTNAYTGVLSMASPTAIVGNFNHDFSFTFK